MHVPFAGQAEHCCPLSSLPRGGGGGVGPPPAPPFRSIRAGGGALGGVRAAAVRLAGFQDLRARSPVAVAVAVDSFEDHRPILRAAQAARGDPFAGLQLQRRERLAVRNGGDGFQAVHFASLLCGPLGPSVPGLCPVR